MNLRIFVGDFASEKYLNTKSIDVNYKLMVS